MRAKADLKKPRHNGGVQLGLPAAGYAELRLYRLEDPISWQAGLVPGQLLFRSRLKHRKRLYLLLLFSVVQCRIALLVAHVRIGTGLQ